MRVLFIFTVLLLSVCPSCRTVQKAVSRADSTAVKTDQSTEKYAREIIREYYADTSKTPVIVNVAAPLPGQTPEPRVIIRETIRETGESKKDVKEQVETNKEEITKEAGVPTELRWAALIFAGAFLLFALAFMVKQFK